MQINFTIRFQYFSSYLSHRLLTYHRFFPLFSSHLLMLLLLSFLVQLSLLSFFPSFFLSFNQLTIYTELNYPLIEVTLINALLYIYAILLFRKTSCLLLLSHTVSHDSRCVTSPPLNVNTEVRSAERS